MSAALERVAAELRAEGGLLAAALGLGTAAGEGGGGAGPGPVPEPGPEAGPAGGSGPASIAAGGPLAAACPAEYEQLIEAIYEGYCQHYGRPRLMAEAEPDLRLLAGDRLYALGLERLVGLGDVAAVVELADVISLCALVHSRGLDELAGLIWTGGARAVGWGPSEAYVRAKALLIAGDADGPAALRASVGAVVSPPEERGR